MLQSLGFFSILVYLSAFPTLSFNYYSKIGLLLIKRTIDWGFSVEDIPLHT
jgi:hypothetical protein